MWGRRDGGEERRCVDRCRGDSDGVMREREGDGLAMMGLGDCMGINSGVWV